MVTCAPVLHATNGLASRTRRCYNGTRNLSHYPRNSNTRGQHVFDYSALEADICNYSVGLRIKPCPVEHVSDCTELKIYDNAYIRAQ